MNEKIKQLALQAGIGFTLWDDSGREMIDNYTPEEDLAKFAELIVKECAQAFEAEVDTWKEMDPYQGSMKRKGTQAIKEHFGVEE